MDSINWIFIIIPIVAFFYGAVGHGGASGYLALMALFSFPVSVMKPTALLLNLFVSAISFYHYWRTGNFNFKLFIAFAVGSIPLSFLGGTLDIDTHVYKITLGILLLFAIARMLNLFGKESEQIRPVKWGEGIAIGGAIGFFSGLIGIGGGIILSPVILLMRWGKMKEAAAVSALFIWVNSAAGMAGQLVEGVTLDQNSILMVILASIGGFLGAYLGSQKLSNKWLRYLLAIVLTMASIKLFII